MAAFFLCSVHGAGEISSNIFKGGILRYKVFQFCIHAFGVIFVGKKKNTGGPVRFHQPFMADIVVQNLLRCGRL